MLIEARSYIIIKNINFYSKLKTRIEVYHSKLNFNSVTLNSKIIGSKIKKEDLIFLNC